MNIRQKCDKCSFVGITSDFYNERGKHCKSCAKCRERQRGYSGRKAYKKRGRTAWMKIKPDFEAMLKEMDNQTGDE